MHGNSNDRRALEREALRNVINQWNANRLDLFELSEPNEDLEFHGVMRFYFQDSGQKVATKCIRVASDATVEDVIGTLVEKFRPDMRMLSVPSYALYELHEGCPERQMAPDEKPLLVQLNWHVDDREGRFLLKNIDDRMVNSVSSIDSNASFRRKLSKREKKQLKKQEKLYRIKSENGDINNKDSVAEKLYTELPETLFTRSISNPEAVMRRRRQQKLERKLQQFRSKDGGPDTGGTLKIYGEALCKDVPYKTLLLSIRDCASAVVREMLDKYGLMKMDPSQWCLVQVTQQNSGPDVEYILDDDECPLAILMNATNTGSIMFHVRRRPTDCAPRKRKKKPGAQGNNASSPRDLRGESTPLLVELGPDGSIPHPSDTSKTVRLTNDVMEVGSAKGIALQLYGPHIQPRHCVITNTDGVTSLLPCHPDAHTYVNGQRIHQATALTHGSVVKFGHSNTYRFLDPSQEERLRHMSDDISRLYDSRSPRELSPVDSSREHNIVETTFDLEGNVETISTASGARDDNRSLGSASENRLSGMDRFPRGQDPILPAVLEFPEEPQEQFLARVITHLDVTVPTFRLAPAYTLYLCARYRASTHYRPELTPTERAHKLTLLLQHAAMLVRHTVQDRSTESISQAFWLANASELLHFLKSDRHVSAFSIQAQETLADAVQSAFKNLIACLTDELNSIIQSLMSPANDDHLRELINILSGAMNLFRKCRVNAALTIQLFSHLFHWISAKALAIVINNGGLCTRSFGNKLSGKLKNLQVWAESQGLELAAECHLAKIVQCAYLLQASKYTPEELANLSAACFKLNSMQLGALLRNYKAEPSEKLASLSLLEQAAKAAEGVADELIRAEGREVALYEDPAPPLQLLLPDDGFSCDVVQGVPPGLADFLLPLQASGLCRLAAQPTSSGKWTVYMREPRPPSALSSAQPEIQVIRLHKSGGGMGLSIVAAKGSGQERLGIYIKSVVPGGAADRDGRLAAGDQLLAVDGQSLLGIAQEKAAEFLVRTGSVVTLEVAKGGAMYHGLATALLQQPSPQPHRGPRRMSERDLPSRVDFEKSIPSSKSVPALHHIATTPEQPPRSSHEMFNPGYSRTSSNNSINTNSAPAPALPHNGLSSSNPVASKSRSTHNLHQQDGGFYQNLSIYRNKIPSPQHLGERTSGLRSSQNSLQSSTVNSQRPSSAYYPPTVATASHKNNLHQSIPNLKSSLSTNRLYYDDYAPGAAVQNPGHGFNHGPQQNYANQNSYSNEQGFSPNYLRKHEEFPPKTYGSSPYMGQMREVNAPQLSPTHGNNHLYQNNQLLQVNGFRGEDRAYDMSYGGVREEVGHPQSNRISIEERFSNSNNKSHEIHSQAGSTGQDEHHFGMRISKSDDFISHGSDHQNEFIKYPSSVNLRPSEHSRSELAQFRQNSEHYNRPGYEHCDPRQNISIRGQAKLAEMGEELKRRQNRILSPSYIIGSSPSQGPSGQHPVQHYNQQPVTYSNNMPPSYSYQVSQNMQNLQNLKLNQHDPIYSSNSAPHPHYIQNPPTSPNYKLPPVAPKPLKRRSEEEIPIPAVPPTNTHPLYSASTQDPPRMSYTLPGVAGMRTARDPWAREEQERQQEVRREAARQWQEHQIRELMALSSPTPQQEEQLRVLQLEREFQRRAKEASEDDDDTEKESPVSETPPQPSFGQPSVTNSGEPQKSETVPTSILKPGSSAVATAAPVQSDQEPTTSSAAPYPPPPPERGSSFNVMSMRLRESTKRVSFNDAATQPPPTQLPLQIEEKIQEDPNSFIRQAESMLASPTTPPGTSVGGASAVATPGVIGAQEVYRDPRTKRLAEQAQQRILTTPVPEKLSFKEKMKMFAMETGEQETPKDKSKISRAQREIDSMDSPQQQQQQQVDSSTIPH